jgi:hypothetical protein
MLKDLEQAYKKDCIRDFKDVSHSQGEDLDRELQVSAARPRSLALKGYRSIVTLL